MNKTPHRRIMLDTDSSESPVRGKQKGLAYKSHFGCTCFHPLFCFNQFGDCEGVLLRPGNVHSADQWKELLEQSSRDTRIGISGVTFVGMLHLRNLISMNI